MLQSQLVCVRTCVRWGNVGCRSWNKKLGQHTELGKEADPFVNHRSLVHPKPVAKWARFV